MPLVKIENIHEGVSWGLWKIEESTEELTSSIPIADEESIELTRISNEKRKKEWLGARILMRSILDQWSMHYQGIYKDDHEKPHLIGLPGHISISHAYPYATAIVSRDHPCGIDIERPKEALFQIAGKFLHPSESSFAQDGIEKLCISWAAKEVIYKIHGKKYLSFKDQIIIDPFSPEESGHIEVNLIEPAHQKKYTLTYRSLDHHVICLGY